MENDNGRGNVPHRQPPNMSFFCRIFLLYFVFFFITMLRNSQIQITIKISEPPSKHGTSDRKLAAENKDVYHPRSVFESNYTDMEANFKIYAYPTYNEEDDDEAMKYSNEGQKGCEWYFLKNLRESSFVTDNPDEAHFFFVPLSNHRMLQQVSSEKDLGFLVEKYMHHLISEYPYWNRTLGSDHFFISCGKIDIRAIESIQSLIENSTRLVCSPSHYKSGHKDVSIPSVSAPLKGQHKVISIKKRKKIVDDSDLFGKASSTVQLSFNNLQNNESFHLYNNVQTQRYDRFCICLGSGSKPTSGCIISSIRHKCVPVFKSADYYDLPFCEVLDWRNFSVIVRDYQVPFLGIILNLKSGKRYEALYRNLLKVRHHFEWNSDALSYDAFHMALYDLWMRRKAVEEGEVF